MRKHSQSPAEAGTGASEPQAAAAPDAKAELLAMFDREASALDKKPIVDPKGGFTASVAAAGAPTVTQVEAVSVVEIPLGTQAPVRCQLFPEEVDAGGTLALLMRDLSAKVQPKRVAPAAVKVIGESPTAFVSMLYHAQSPRGMLLGELKAALIALPVRTVLCMHDEPGYRKTFETVVTDFGESLKLKQPAPARSYLEIQGAYLGDSPIGFSTASLAAKDGEREFSTLSTLMINRSETDVTFQDSLNAETIDAQDRLISGMWVEAEGGEVTLNVKLEQVKGKPGTYRYEGTLQGKPLSGEVSTKDRKPIPGTIATWKRVAREAKKGGAFSVAQQSYTPDLDPTRLLDFKYFRSAGDPAKSFRFEAGSLKLTGTLDNHGFAERMELPAGAQVLSLRREHIRGKL